MAHPDDTSVGIAGAFNDQAALKAQSEVRPSISRLKDFAQDTAASAAELAKPAVEEAQKEIGKQWNTAPDRLAGAARAVHEVADKLKDELPAPGPEYIHQAAAGIERISTAVRDKSVSDIVAEIDGFARRQPAAFFAGSVLVGFVLTRFLKSSAAN